MTPEKSIEKLPYEKPMLNIVKFAVDEAVFANCKIAGQGNGRYNWNIGCTGSGWGGYACSTPGS